MIKLAAISPRTGSLMVNQGDSSPEKQQFEQLFSEKAHATLGAKSPELANSIVHFKTLESSLEKNTASGIFICLVGEVEIHIPIMLAGGKIKSPEVFFDPNGGSFYPLTQKFLKTVSSPSSSDLGKSQKEVNLQDLGTPDIGGITSPPSTSGKFASYDLPLLMSKLPNSVKSHFKGILKTSEVVLRSGVKYHGKDFVEALAEAKIASSLGENEYTILSSFSSPEEYKSAFGDRHKLAFQEALQSGYVAVDFRKNAAEVVTAQETPIKASEPTTSGVYKLLKSDGKALKAYVVRAPVDMSGERTSRKFLCILENGDYLLTDKVSALDTAEGISESSALFKRMKADPSYRTGTATFIKVLDGQVQGCTLPEKLSNISSGSAGRVTARLADHGLTAVITKDGASYKPYRPKGESTVFIPNTYKPLYLRNQLSESDFMSDPDAIRKLVTEGLSKNASLVVRARKGSAGEYVIDGVNVGEEYQAVEKLASAGASVKSAKGFLRGLTSRITSTGYLVPRSNLLKLGSIFSGTPSAPDASFQAGMEAPMPPGMAPPPPPGMAPPPGIPMEQQVIMEEAARVNDQKVLDATVASVLLEQAGLKELTSEYIPKLSEALDSLGRILLTVQMNDYTLSEQVGPEEYTKLENSLKKVFHGLGDIILRLHQTKNVPEEGADLYGFSA